MACAYYNLGTIYGRMGQYDRALTYLTKAIELDPNFVNAYINRAAVYQAIGKNAEAQADLAKAAQLKAAGQQ